MSLWPSRTAVARSSTLVASILLGVVALVSTYAAPGDGSESKMSEQPESKASGRGLIAEMSAFHTDVPAHPFDIVLVRPTATSITVSVLSYADTEGYIEFGTEAGTLDRRTASKPFKAGVPELFVLDGLAHDTGYSYRWRYREGPDAATKAPAKGAAFALSPPYSFHTPRKAGHTGAFTFTIQADSHLDSNMTPAVYERTLANALADKPDFHVDLGDTFMTDKRRDFHEALPQYIAQRYYFGQLCHSAPIFMVLGNHDGEWGYAAAGPDEMAGWSFAQRTRLFPPPQIYSATDLHEPPMYTGRTSLAKGQGANYYAFEWGDAQIVVLDPFWFTATRARGPKGAAQAAQNSSTDENWTRTLGRGQYDWLDRTLAASKARFKFVFVHHLVGGLGRDARGGVEAAPYFEWGGKNADGSEGFAAHRAGWPMPIHRLLVERGVAAVFHGHDHMYVRSELDGVVYQCVPQPGNPRGGTRSAEEYGYTSGTILGSPGHLRVRMNPNQAQVEFVRSALEQPPDARRREREDNGAVVNAYEIKPRTPSSPARGNGSNPPGAK